MQHFDVFHCHTNYVQKSLWMPSIHDRCLLVWNELQRWGELAFLVFISLRIMPELPVKTCQFQGFHATRHPCMTSLGLDRKKLVQRIAAPRKETRNHLWIKVDGHAIYSFFKSLTIDLMLWKMRQELLPTGFCCIKARFIKWILDCDGCPSDGSLTSHAQ